MPMRSSPIAIVLWTFGLLLLGGSAPGSAANRGDEIAAPYKPGTVRIEGSGGDGFGFAVGEGRGWLYVVTAKHVVSGPGEEHLLFFEHDRYTPHAAQVLQRG